MNVVRPERLARHRLLVALSLLGGACTSDLREKLEALESAGSGCAAGTHAAADAGADARCVPCRVGTFCGPGSYDAQPCPADTWDHDADPKTACEPWTNCPVGEYVLEPGTDRRDRTCAPCEQGSFSAEPNQAECRSFTRCEPGTYVRVSGDANNDQVCSPCASGTYSREPNLNECRPWTECDSDEAELGAGSASQDRVCSACSDSDGGVVACSEECEPGTVQIGTGVDAAASVCAPCEEGQYCAGGSSGLVSCGGANWDHDADPTTACKKHTDCVPGEYVETEGGALADRKCDACPSATFSTSTNAASCRDFQRCEAGTFLVAAGTRRSDVECAGCAAGSFSSTENAAGCSLWTDCQPGEFVSVVGSALEDRECEPCPEDTYSDGINFGACVAEGECAPGTYKINIDEAGPADCDACEPGQFCAGGVAAAVECEQGSWDHDEDPATPCAAMTPCAAGEHIATAGGPLTDRTCEACAAGSFSDAINSAECEVWRTCSAGTYVLESGSTVSDRNCDPCPTGTFSTTTDATSCTAWTTCTAPSLYLANSPDATTDRVCETCEAPEETLRDNESECIVPAFQMDDGLVAMEAEHFHLQELNGSQHEWQLVDEAAASGGECMVLNPEAAYQWSSPVGYAPSLQFRVDFTTTGTHYVNLKGDARTGGGGSDSCYAAIDNQLSGVYDFDDQAGQFGWRQQTLSVDTVGRHTVTIWPSEDGFCLDKIVISSSATSPTEDGPAESPEG